MAQVQRLGQALDPAERPAFTTFVAIHGRTAGNCGITLGGGESRTPETIGEAIDAMQLRLAQVQASSAAPGGAPEPPIAPSGAYTGPSLAEVNRQMEILER